MHRFNDGVVVARADLWTLYRKLVLLVVVVVVVAAAATLLQRRQVHRVASICDVGSSQKETRVTPSRLLTQQT